MNWLAHLKCDRLGEVVGLFFKQVSELAHAEGAMLKGDGDVSTEGRVGQSDLFKEGFFRKRLKAAKELSVGGIDGFDGHAESAVCQLSKDEQMRLSEMRKRVLVRIGGFPFCGQKDRGIGRYLPIDLRRRVK